MVAHTHILRVRYGECDAQKVVFNSRYGDYVDVAVLEFMRALPMGERFLNGELDYQLVKQTTEWRAPARFDDQLAITVAPVALGNTSFTLRADFRLVGGDEVITTSETVYVLVSGATLSKMPLPDDVRAALTV
ncbi:MAG: thioesterase family protein [Moraxellaceae bacterium]|nr:thioesterase family protein [Moraxellaceae bacterium]